MKILIAHNRYVEAGGEDAVVRAEIELLRRAGHEVIFHGTDNDSIVGLAAQFETAARVVYSKPARQRMAEAIAEHRPDLLHVHNFFPRLTPSIYDAAAEVDLPVVQTFHNYRTICPGGLLMRDGLPCEDCVGSSPYRAVRMRCYRGSTLGSLAVAHMVAIHLRRRTWSTRVHRIVALTEFARGRFVAGGIHPSNIVVKPNFMADPRGNAPAAVDGVGAVYVGRLSREKGLPVLIEAWRDQTAPLTVIGDGPLYDSIAQSAPESVRMTGRLNHDAVLAAMSGASFVVLPSLCYEGFPMAIVEAFAMGLPVVCSDIGGMAEIVEDGETGLHFRAGDAADLRAKVEALNADPERCRRMGAVARKRYEAHYGPEQNLALLERIYAEACQLAADEAAGPG